MRKGEQTFAAFSPTLEVSSGTVWGYQVKDERKKKRRKKERKKERNIYQTNVYGVLSVGSEETKWISGPTIPKLEIHTHSFCFLSVLTYTHLSPPPYNLSTPNPTLSCLSWHTHISHLHPVILLSLIGWIHVCPFFLLSFPQDC